MSIRVYTEEEVKAMCANAHWHGWVCRERLDGPDSFPVPLTFPPGLDYEEKEDFCFDYFWLNYKPKTTENAAQKDTGYLPNTQQG